MTNFLSLKNSFFISAIFHGTLIFLLVYHSDKFYKPKNVLVGNTPVLNVHLIKPGLITPRKETSPSRQLPYSYQHRHIAPKKNGIRKAVIADHMGRSQSLSSIKKTGHKNNLMILIHNLIVHQQRYPQTALLLEQQGRVEIEFVLLPDGTIRNIRLIHANQHPLLNKDALRTVQAINPILRASQYIHHNKVMRVWIQYQIR